MSDRDKMAAPVGSSAAVIAIAGLVVANTARVLGLALAAGMGTIAGYFLYRKLSDQSEDRERTVLDQLK